MEIKPKMVDSSRKSRNIPIRGGPQLSGGVAAVSYFLLICCVWCCMSIWTVEAGGGSVPKMKDGWGD